MALCTPLLILLLCGTAEWGYLFYRSIDCVNAVREGARFTAKQLVSKEKILAKINETAMFDISKIWILPAMFVQGTPTAAMVVAEMDYNPITPFDKIMGLVTGNSDSFKFTFLRSTAVFQFQEDFYPEIFDAVPEFLQEKPASTTTSSETEGLAE
jgi:Flp pilus assembly protein TadG